MGYREELVKYGALGPEAKARVRKGSENTMRNLNPESHNTTPI